MTSMNSHRSGFIVQNIRNLALSSDTRLAMTAQTFTIAAIPADGVGKEVVAAGREILDYLAEHSAGRFSFSWEEFPWGSEYYDKTGEMMDPDGLEILKNFDAIYFGAVGRPQRVRSI